MARQKLLKDRFMDTGNLIMITEWDFIAQKAWRWRKSGGFKEKRWDCELL